MKWALVSVFDKTGIVDFCQTLAQAGYGILSTGGTADTLRKAGIEVTAVEDYTGFPEMMNGRVKTLHPKVHGALLGVRDNEQHQASMAEHGIADIAMVVVNLYPFEQTIAKPGVTFAEAVEMIDIGGPSMLRSAAKNHRFVLPVVDPSDYTWLAERIATGGTFSDAERTALAAKTFATTQAYDTAIAAYLQQHGAEEGAGVAGSNAAMQSTVSDGTTDAVAEPGWPEIYRVEFHHKQALRYGENPHQAAHFYVEQGVSPATIGGAVQLQGKELSYNNIQDADAALRILRDLDTLAQPAVVAVKHMNPCGVGIGDDILQAFDRAYEADPVSIFGGIIACNRTVDGDLAERLTAMFLEIVMAPGFTEDARQRFARKKNVRLLTVDMSQPLWKLDDHVFRRVSGGLLVQTVDSSKDTGAAATGAAAGGASEEVGGAGVAAQGTAETAWQVVTKRQPTPEEWAALRFGWLIVKHVKSNAIVLTSDVSTLGIGAGQMNRVGAAKIAIEQAGERAQGSALASDAFFPMRDTVDTAAAAGVTAIVQPGGSIKDDDSIAAADEVGITMLFTHHRHFLH